MGHVRLSRIARLALVALAGEAIGFFEDGKIVLGPILLHLGLKFTIKLLHRIGGDAGCLGEHLI
jgi:hypothetical protein